MSDTPSQRIDWRGADLRGVNLAGVNLEGVEAQQADFRGADLRQANFGGAYLEGAMMPPPTASKDAAAHLPSPSHIARNAADQKPEPPRGNGQDRTPHQEHSRGR